MTNLLRSMQISLRICAWLAAGSVAVTALGAQTPAPRIRAEVSASEMAPVTNSKPFARPDLDAGRVPADTRLVGITLVRPKHLLDESGGLRITLPVPSDVSAGDLTPALSA